MKRFLTLLVLALALAVLTPVALAATTSAARNAKAQVCFASADISNEVLGFGNLVVAPGTPDEVRRSLLTIQADLQTIGTTLPATSLPFRQQATAGGIAFLTGLRRLVPALLIAPSGPAPAQRLALFSAAVKRLPQLYQLTLGRVSC